MQWSFASHKLSRRTPLQSAVRAVYPYGSVATVKRGPLKGWRVVVSPSMGFSFIWHRQADEWSWLRVVRAGSCVYDVGANFGQSTLRLAHAVGPQGRVVAFEPMPKVFATLCRNLDLNNLSQVTPVEAAVAQSGGSGHFAADLSLPTQGRLSFSGIPSGTPFDVRLVALDSFEAMGWPRPDLLKIDVEGGAGAVIAGGHRLFDTVRPVVYIELHSQEEHDAVGNLRDQYGYVIRNMREEIVEDPRTAHYCGPLICRPT